MKITILLSFSFLLSISCFTQVTHYNIAKAGLNIRQSPSEKSEVIGKINYGEAVTYFQSNKDMENEWKDTVIVDGMRTNWSRISYKGMTGYVIKDYLFPYKAPADSMDDLEHYVNRIAKPLGKEWKKENDNEDGNMEGYGTAITKRLYDNGMFYTLQVGYEYSSESLHIPGINMNQAYNLMKLFRYYNAPFQINTALKKGKSSYKSSYGDMHNWDVRMFEGAYYWYPESIYIDWCDGGCYTMRIVSAEDGVFIVVGGGV